jgi:hypothetical protein
LKRWLKSFGAIRQYRFLTPGRCRAERVYTEKSAGYAEVGLNAVIEMFKISDQTPPVQLPLSQSSIRFLP